MTLLPNAFWRPDAPHHRLVVTAGQLWATRTGDPFDAVLEAGDTLELKGKGWLVQALGGTPCDFSTSTSSPIGPTRAIPSRSSSRKAG